jgi:quinol monooxygenase YgiN
LLLSVVQVSLSIVARPGRSTALAQALRGIRLLAQGARGFLGGRLLVDADNANALFYVEVWRSSTELDQQLCSTEYTRLLALMEEAAEPPELQLSWVTDVKGLEYLEAVRLGPPGSN